MRGFLIACASIASLLWLAGAPASADEAKAPSIDALKKLAGDWVMVGEDGKPQDKVAVIYKVTAAGSAVVETLFPGTDHEMVTVYHQDGKDLVLTHYCALGNQPHLRASPGKEPNTFVFNFVSCSNIKSPDDMHMHEGMLTIIDDNHIKSSWTGYNKGKPGHSVHWDLVRKPK